MFFAFNAKYTLLLFTVCLQMLRQTLRIFFRNYKLLYECYNTTFSLDHNIYVLSSKPSGEDKIKLQEFNSYVKSIMWHTL